MANTKIVIPSGSELINIIGEMAGVFPVPVKKNMNGDNKLITNTALKQ